MSSTLDSETGKSLEKTPNETSLRAIQSHTQFDGINDANANDSTPNQHGFSPNDRSDMRRMGKVQELGIRSVSDYI